MTTSVQMAIRGGTLLTDGLEIQADLFVDQGRVIGWGQGLEIASEASVDASGCYVLPGLVDLDTMLDASVQGQLTPDYVYNVSKLSMLGGVTTACIDLPLNASVDRDALTSGLCVDVCYRGLMAKRGDAGVRKKLGDGVREEKLVGGRAALRGMPPHLEGIGEEDLLNLLREMANARPLFLFPEHGPLGDVAARDAARFNTPHEFRAALHPATLIRAGLRWLTLLLEHQSLSGGLVVLPITAAAGVEALIESRERLGVGMMAMTSLPYLVFHTPDDAPPPNGKMPIGYPPPRRKTDVAALWKALEAGVIDAVGTGSGLLVPEAYGHGAFALPAMYGAGVMSRRVAPTVLASVLCDNPAKLAGLYPAKGSLQVGADADVVVFDPAANTTAPPDSPFAAIPMAGGVRTVLRHGRVVVHEGQPQPDAPAGRDLALMAVDVTR